MEDQSSHTALTGMAEYVSALDSLAGRARHTLFIFDRNFSDIGFNDIARHDVMRQFLLASPANRLYLLAHDVRQATQYCPRLLELLRQFSHNMHIHQTPKHHHHLSEPYAVADSMHYLRRFHFDDLHGQLALDDPGNARVLMGKFEEMWAASRPGISATTLGL